MTKLKTAIYVMVLMFASISTAFAGNIPPTRTTGNIPPARTAGNIPPTRTTGNIPATRTTTVIEVRGSYSDSISRLIQLLVATGAIF